MSPARVVWLPLIAGLLIPGCGLGEADDYAPLTVTDNFRVIEDGQAYRSAQLDASTLRLVVRQYGIRTVINLRGENAVAVWYQRERATAEELKLKLVDIPLSAHRLPSRANLLQLYDTFKAADGPILIHCSAGSDRTGAAAAIWRMVVRGEPRAAAVRELSLLNGHFAQACPEMDQLVRIFQPSRDWIMNEYPGP
jgi:protein tyrosine/serine phosphatase